MQVQNIILSASCRSIPATLNLPSNPVAGHSDWWVSHVCDCESLSITDLHINLLLQVTWSCLQTILQNTEQWRACTSEESLLCMASYCHRNQHKQEQLRQFQSITSSLWGLNESTLRRGLKKKQARAGSWLVWEKKGERVLDSEGCFLSTP